MKYEAEIVNSQHRKTEKIELNCTSIIFISLNQNAARPTLVEGFPLAYRQPYAISMQSDTTLKGWLNLTIPTNANPDLIDLVHVIKTYAKPV